MWVHDNWLFCKQCVSIVDESMMEQLIHVLGTKLRNRHVLTHRNLCAFAPHAKPHKSLLMLADDNDPFWMPK